MNSPRVLVAGFAWLVFAVSPSRAADAPKLCTPDASAEAVALYQFLLETSGKNTLAGQHSVPMLGSPRLSTAFAMTGRYPAVFSQDFGISAPGTWDGINYRQQIVDEDG